MRVGRSVLGVFASNALNVVLSFGNSIFLTRTLGVVGRGEFAVFSASFGILTLLFGLGLDVSLRYWVAKERVPRDRILTSLLLFGAMVGAVVFATARLNHALFDNELLLPFSKQDPRMELVLAGVVVATMVHGNVASVFAGTRSFRTLNLSSIAFAALGLMVYAGLWTAQRSGTWAVGSDEVFLAYLALAALSAVVLAILAYRQLGVSPSLRLLDGPVLRDMLRYAGLAYVANVVQFLNYRVDVWIVQSLTGSAALGLYSLAASLAMMLWMLPRSMASVLLPASAAGEAGASFEAMARLGRLAFAATVVVALPLAVLAGPLIGVLYGAEFVPAARPLVILLLGCVPFTLCVIHASALAGADRQGVNLAASALGLVATVVLDFTLIPRFGIEGAAVASSVSYVATTLVVLWSFARIGAVPVRACVLPLRADLRYVTDGLQSLLR